MGISWGTGMLEMRMTPILSSRNVCMHLKEIRMIRRAVTLVLLTSLGGLSPGALAVANDESPRAGEVAERASISPETECRADPGGN